MPLKKSEYGMLRPFVRELTLSSLKKLAKVTAKTMIKIDAMNIKIDQFKAGELSEEESNRLVAYCDEKLVGVENLSLDGAKQVGELIKRVEAYLRKAS
jgi:hypothetical protein